jgi:predicted transcriptional regulator
MGKYKENPKYNVVSMRVSDEEKLALEEMTRLSSKSISRLMREAIQMYSPIAANLRQAGI